MRVQERERYEEVNPGQKTLMRVPPDSLQFCHHSLDGDGRGAARPEGVEGRAVVEALVTETDARGTLHPQARHVPVALAHWTPVINYPGTGRIWSLGEQVHAAMALAELPSLQ